MDENFKLNDKNCLLNHIYRHDNYKVIEGMVRNKKCLVFCSSNGIYYPNNNELFRQKIICNDFYEYSRIASLCIDYVERIIFIRDVRKNFYVTGINEQYDSIDKVVELIRKYTDGYEVTVAGSSAGGYMAIILGIKLHARKVIEQGGQWNLYKHGDVVKNYYFLNKWKDTEDRNLYYDLDNIVDECKTPIFGLYGVYSENDIIQSKLAMKYDNVYAVCFNTDIHAPSVSTIPYIQMLLAESDELRNIFNRNKNEIIEIEDMDKQIMDGLFMPKINLYIEQDKKTTYNNLMYEWISAKQTSLSPHIDGGVYAIWGSGKYCTLLLNELINADNVSVKCIIESNPLRKEFSGYPIVSIENIPTDIDTIIVIPYYDIERIRESVNMYNCNVTVVGVDEFIKGAYVVQK